MRVSTLFPLLALITSAFAVTLPASDACEPGSEICAEQDAPSATVTVDLEERAPITNAERFARGLPPAPPKWKRGRRHGPSRTHTCSPSPSPRPPVTYKGMIQLFANDVSLGFVAQDPNYWTPLLTPDPNSATLVSLTLPNGATTGSTLDLTLLNQIKAPSTLLSVSEGRDSTSPNFAPGSFNYGYVGQSGHTEPNALPAVVPSYFSTSTGLEKSTESAIWSVDLTTGALAAQWINSDGSKPVTIAFVQSNHLYVGGDPAAFQSRFPAPVTPVTLKFVQVV